MTIWIVTTNYACGEFCSAFATKEGAMNYVNTSLGEEATFVQNYEGAGSHKTACIKIANHPFVSFWILERLLRD